jgi:hypothetical protein
MSSNVSNQNEIERLKGLIAAFADWGNMENLTRLRVELKRIEAQQTIYNSRPVKEVVSGMHYEVADFRGRYVAVNAGSAEDAVKSFVEGRFCNHDTPFHISEAWRIAACPTREAWEAINTTSVQ